MRLLPFFRWLSYLLGSSLLGSTLVADEATGSSAEVIEYELGRYQIYRIDKVDLNRLQLLWLGDDQKPLGGMEGLRSYLRSHDLDLAFATNAGIFERGPKPCGLTICQYEEQVPLNTERGEGNFYLQPNGVFLLDEHNSAQVVTTAEVDDAVKRASRIRVATQSGPLLLRRGVIHPAFQPNSPNRRLRNGVGVRKSDGQVIFAMSNREDRDQGRVTFHQLARLFIHLGCEDALYLDGDISEMIVNPPTAVAMRPNTFGAIFFISRDTNENVR